MESKKGNKKDYKLRATSSHYDEREKEMVMDNAIEYDSKSKEVKQVSTKEIKREDREREER